VDEEEDEEEEGEDEDEDAKNAVGAHRHKESGDDITNH
jgi:hypothetical protein